MRIGPKMKDAMYLISLNPGCNKAWIAKRVGPHGSLKFGYPIVNRLIQAGLIQYEKVNGWQYRLYPIDR